MGRNSSANLLPEDLMCREPIYHYTSAVGFLGVIESHAVWASEAFGMNDVAELRHGWNFVREWLGNHTSDEVTVEMESHLQNPDVASPEVEVFMCCASTLCDDASQWRLYADAARGYAIEFDPSVDLAVMARHDAFPEGEPPINYGSVNNMWAVLRDHAQVSPWMHVMYADEDKADALAYYHASLRGLLDDYDRKIRDADSQEDADELSQEWQGEVRSGLTMLAHCMKSRAFAGEAEVRTVATLFYDNHAKFRPTPYGVARYVPLITSPGDGVARVVRSVPSELPIRRVWLGPGQVAQNSWRAADAALKRGGYEVPVEASSAALR